MVLGAAACAVAGISDDVRVNSIGYKPAFAKHATIMGDHGAAEWQIRRAADNNVVLTGKLAAATKTLDCHKTVQLADFSALTKPGKYVLNVDGVGGSVPFVVADDVYNNSLELQLAALHGQRCGMAVTVQYDGVDYTHGACHLSDGKMSFITGEEQVLNGNGGWHDAGDYGKYMVNGAFTVGMLLKAWEHFPEALGELVLPIPERGGKYPDFLAEVKWELDWMLKNAAVYGDGRIPHKLTRTSFSGSIAPTKDEDARYWSPYGSAATADFVAVMAMASRIYRAYDTEFADTMLAAAEKSYAWLQANPKNVNPDQSTFKTGAYPTVDKDDRLWAAAELWETTGRGEVLKDLEARIFTFDDRSARYTTWEDTKNLAVITYLESKREGKDLEEWTIARNDIIGNADSIVAYANAHGFGRGVHRYFWGANGAVASQGLVLRAAYNQTGKQKYVDCAIHQISHLYGRNTYNRSMVSREGLNPPVHPHHRPSEADGIDAPWPGMMIGGGWPNATDWKDEPSDYKSNEVAINWMADMIYILGMFADYSGN